MLKEIIRKKCLTIGFSNDFFGYVIKSTTTKAKVEKYQSKNVLDNKESVSCSFDYYSFRLKSGTMIPPTLLIFLKIALATQILLWFCINFRVILVVWRKKKNFTGIFIGIALCLQTVFSGMEIFKNILILLNLKHTIPYHFFVSFSNSLIIIL